MRIGVFEERSWQDIDVIMFVGFLITPETKNYALGGVWLNTRS